MSEAKGVESLGKNIGNKVSRLGTKMAVAGELLEGKLTIRKGWRESGSLHHRLANRRRQEVGLGSLVYQTPCDR